MKRMENEAIDLKGFALGEGTAAEREAARRAIAAEPDLREEFERLELTLTALRGVREEEMPRRIAFVSDPVFEPSWWQRFWGSGRLVFAGAAMLAVAIVAHGYLMRPGPAAVPVAAAGLSQPDVDRAIDAAVGRAVAQVEERAAERTRQQVKLAVEQSEKRFSQELQMVSAAMQENETILRKQLNRLYVTNAGLSVGPNQE
jgi:hypothetical protein